MTDRYAVVGNPIAHSKSPIIHAIFAKATNQDLTYDRLLAPLDGFLKEIDLFKSTGGCGLNITVPFKLEAFEYAATQGRLTERAQLAGAVNTLHFSDTGVIGDNTDGAGLVRDITINQATSLTGKRVLLIGAGGASRGALGPILDEQPGKLVIVNRTKAKAEELAELCKSEIVSGIGFDELTEHYDIIINASSSSLSAEKLPLPTTVFEACELAYDMMYAAEPTIFMQQAATAGAKKTIDGIGMLIEQAAEAFYVWRHVRPPTTSVFETLRPST
ncbi:shikimate dehydrogenase [Leeia sp. TBRC 13508]|uniref:Shikimate dehydrogenase (NADP(+)) n=1 Tax=Leeia speluncae TaxID=2884804 RepID=A0ABS8D7E8_9NEIS|nr:shikimate dehydrogenase [Leeia speluncae]MCB6184114.1 shikimate dehydrogenase [Leeia speluncae]